MRLTIVGCAGSYPGPDSPASCYLVEHEGTRIALDMGNGTFGALQRHTDAYALDGVVLSYLHADHCLDLTSFYVFRRYHPDGHAPVIPVLGPTGSADRMARAYDLPPEEGMHGEFEFRDHVATTEIGSLRITTVRVNSGYFSASSTTFTARFVRSVSNGSRAGAKLLIASHATSAGELDRLRYGLDQARRGWCEAKDVANALDVEALQKLLARR